MKSEEDTSSYPLDLFRSPTMGYLPNFPKIFFKVFFPASCTPHYISQLSTNGAEGREAQEGEEGEGTQRQAKRFCRPAVTASAPRDNTVWHAHSLPLRRTPTRRYVAARDAGLRTHSAAKGRRARDQNCAPTGPAAASARVTRGAACRCARTSRLADRFSAPLLRPGHLKLTYRDLPAPQKRPLSAYMLFSKARACSAGSLLSL